MGIEINTRIHDKEIEDYCTCNAHSMCMLQLVKQPYAAP